jgi:hypothetical protein
MQINHLATLFPGSLIFRKLKKSFFSGLGPCSHAVPFQAEPNIEKLFNIEYQISKIEN